MLSLPQHNTTPEDSSSRLSWRESLSPSGCLPKVSLQTLGCKLNQFETDSLAQQFLGEGYQLVGPNDAADLTIVNTCTVTAKADAKSRQVIGKAHRQNPEGAIVATGCYATTDAAPVAQLPGVVAVVPNAQKYALFDMVHKGISAPDEDNFGYTVGEPTFHTRAYLKVQDGCNNRCSYCKIPQSRGPASSHPFRAMMDRLSQLADVGYKEVILTGINLADYQDGTVDFAVLLETMLKLAESRNFRIRISSVEPNLVTHNVMAHFDHPHLCNHLHMPLQSGSDRILKLMHRHYDRRQYLQSVDHVQTHHPHVVFTTDLMVGFPTEDDQDFEDSLDVIRHMNAYHVHTFKYSPRDHTPAASMKGQVNGKVASARSTAVRALSEAQGKHIRESLLGQDRTVVVEEVDPARGAKGHTDDWIQVHVPAEGLSKGHFARVTLTGNHHGHCSGELSRG